MRGVFICFEGTDGAGKTTQIKALSRVLAECGVETLCLREPGGTDISEQIRGMLLARENAEMVPMCELMLYEAARAQLVSEVISPALLSCKTVLCDRFFLSTFAYQGYGRGIPLDVIEALNRLSCADVAPDLTIFLKAPAGLAHERATSKAADRMESEDDAFQARVADGFAQLAAKTDDIAVVEVTSRLETLLGVIDALEAGGISPAGARSLKEAALDAGEDLFTEDEGGL